MQALLYFLDLNFAAELKDSKSGQEKFVLPNRLLLKVDYFFSLPVRQFILSGLLSFLFTFFFVFPPSACSIY